ncbi:MAG: spore coat protein [Spirochaetes bacterium GWD1_61_31]|nr:MAG: spore coat protein [Spirochaetes bacterium GWB1_60_80]OHD32690.1 MAG: spore coat protein [Spirochaetes bacterium GWC1_61_12]OHD42104.1 MAG: spore coat protein [Spirochaetes bacterium GWE1_60_18]OHD43361.1 MAG: spore coat protein [Spirochaetes bacterium GWD1_61_31]OHD60998.1 MAG: spore coat protein [Spirochaetes bacterium GWF1_60_12]
MVIAEIGTGHGNDRTRGRELVSAAIEAGADCVKFQHVYADEIIHRNTGLVPLPGGDIPLYARFGQLSCGPDFLAEMKTAAESLGGLFLCTPFGLRSARELRAMGVSAFKVASPELNHLPLLAELAGYGQPTILSSGVSRLGDIEAALEIFRVDQADQATAARPIALLHCVTAYPAPAEDYNLRLLPHLAGLFGIPVGVSDHSLDPILVPALASLCGAVIVEKHICLSRRDAGLDDPIALEPANFASLVQQLRRQASQTPETTLAELVDRYGQAAVTACLGDGRKRLAPSEAANYRRTNRSIHATRAIRRGEALTEENLVVLRTEKVLRPGLEPRLLPKLIGRLAARDLPDGEGVEWADVGAPVA